MMMRPVYGDSPDWLVCAIVVVGMVLEVVRIELVDGSVVELIEVVELVMIEVVVVVR